MRNIRDNIGCLFGFLPRIRNNIATIIDGNDILKCGSFEFWGEGLENDMVDLIVTINLKHKQIEEELFLNNYKNAMNGNY